MVVAHQTTRPKQGHAAGRQLLERLYREYTGGEMPEILVAEWGKPYFAGSPVHFSITHTKHHVFCALSEYPIGIDAEELDRKIDLCLAEKVLSPTELEQFNNAQDKQSAFLRFWVLKEAQAKCTGEGLRGYPCRTAFSLEDPRVQIQNGCLLAAIEDKGE